MPANTDESPDNIYLQKKGEGCVRRGGVGWGGGVPAWTLEGLAGDKGRADGAAAKPQQLHKHAPASSCTRKYLNKRRSTLAKTQTGERTEASLARCRGGPWTQPTPPTPPQPPDGVLCCLFVGEGVCAVVEVEGKHSGCSGGVCVCVNTAGDVPWRAAGATGLKDTGGDMFAGTFNVYPGLFKKTTTTTTSATPLPQTSQPIPNQGWGSALFPPSPHIMSPLLQNFKLQWKHTTQITRFFFLNK